MAVGGKRPGAGRKPGKTVRLLDLLSSKDIEAFKKYLLANYTKDNRLAVWMGDHIFGKAPQSLTGPDGGALRIEFDSSFINHAAPRPPEGDS